MRPRGLALLAILGMALVAGHAQSLPACNPSQAPATSAFEEPVADPSDRGGGQTTPGPGDRGYGPRLPEGEDGGSNAAIGNVLHGIYTFGTLAAIVVIVLLAGS